MNRRMSMLALAGTILISAQTIGIATSNSVAPSATGVDQTCAPCPDPCGDSCPLPCAEDDSSCSPASCSLPGVASDVGEPTVTSLMVE